MAELSDNIHVIECLIDIIELDYVLMRDLFHNIDFRLYVFDVIGIGEDLLVDDLYCNRLRGLDLFAKVNVGV